MKVGFIGFGNMGRALAQGVVMAGVLSKKQILTFDVDPHSIRAAKRFGFERAKGVVDLVKKSDVVFLCVKPKHISPVLNEIRGQGKKSTYFVSIAAGISLQQLQAGVGRGVSVIRVMPNTPAMLKSGMSALSAGAFVRRSHVQFVTKILEAVGRVVHVQEKHMDAVTALSGSGPAYAFLLAEAMIDAGAQLGLPESVAEALARQTMFGAGVMLSQRPEKAAELRRQVTSPGGTTEAALKQFEKNNFKTIVYKALSAAAKRSVEMKKENMRQK